MDILSIIDLLNGIFRDTIPLFLSINFILLIICIFINVSSLKSIVKEISVRTWIMIIVIFIFGLSIRIIVPHRHIIWVDESCYMETGKNILLNNSGGYYTDSFGWLFILSILFVIFGINNHVALYASTFFGAMTIIFTFLLTFIISRNEKLSILAAFIFSLIPTNIMWSSTSSRGAASLFFIVLTIFFCFLYYKNKKFSSLWLALISLSFTSQFRPENYVYPFLFSIGILLFKIKIRNLPNNLTISPSPLPSPPRGEGRVRGFIHNYLNLLSTYKIPKKRALYFIIPWVVLIVLSSPNLFNLLSEKISVNWIESDTGGELTGDNWSVYNFIDNTISYGWDIFSDKYQPIIYSIFFILGFIYMLKKKTRESLFLLIWIISIYIIYFTSWFQTIQGKSRFYMFFTPITIIYTSYGLYFIYNLLVARLRKNVVVGIISFLIIALSISFIPYIYSYAKEYSDDINILTKEIVEKAEDDIPSDCIIVANNPFILKSTTNLKVVDMEVFLEDKMFSDKIIDKNECVLFYEDTFCQINNNRNSFESCIRIFNEFNLELFLIYTHGIAKFKFWKMTKKEDILIDSEFRVINTIPSNGEKGVVRNPSEYIFYFNKPLDPKSVKRDYFDLGEIYFSGGYGYMNNLIVFNVKCYDSYLEKNKSYKIKLREWLKSKNGVSLTPFELRFVTGDLIDENRPKEIYRDDKRYERICR